MTAVARRFGDSAGQIYANGFRSIIPIKPGEKRPLCANWSVYGSEPVAKHQLNYWIRSGPQCGIGAVMTGNSVAVDIDIGADKFPDLEPRQALARALALVDEVTEIARSHLGPVDWRRVGMFPKALLLYRAQGQIETHTGGAIEIFSTPGSKQVVLYGRHPDGREYEWIGPCNPFDSTPADLPAVTAASVSQFLGAALRICDAEIPKPALPESGEQIAPSATDIGPMMADLLSEMFNQEHVPPGGVAAQYLSGAVPGCRHNVMVAAVGALIIQKLADDEIIAALSDVYRAIAPDDPMLFKLRICPRSVRKSFARRARKVDEMAGPGWSLYP
jgi:hypothetical protein